MIADATRAVGATFDAVAAREGVVALTAGRSTNLATTRGAAAAGGATATRGVTTTGGATATGGVAASGGAVMTGGLATGSGAGATRGGVTALAGAGAAARGATRGGVTRTAATDSGALDGGIQVVGGAAWANISVSSPSFRRSCLTRSV